MLSVKDLAEAMTKIPDSGRLPNGNGGNYEFNNDTDIDAGLTYIGQMISHDIVSATQANPEARVVSGFLNLDSLYGPFNEISITRGDRQYFDSDGRFLLGKTNVLDLYRDDENKALIPEQRNDENTIIAQLHHLWLRLHNHLIDIEKVKPENAREIVCLIFQLIVVEEFLRSVLDTDIYDYFFVDNGADLIEQLNQELGEKQFIPFYFSHASFRFGHSIIRNSYLLNDKITKTSLSSLLRQGKALESKFVIKWPRFFNNADSELVTGKTFAFDTLITTGMGEVKLRNKMVNVVKANLEAAEAVNLPKGIEMAELVNRFMPNRVDLLTSTSGATFDRRIDIKELPLWPYILLEAQQQEEESGKRLGKLGSFLNAQVLRASMAKANYSVFTTIDNSYHYNFDGAIRRLENLGLHLNIDRQSKVKLSMNDVIRLIEV